MRRSPIVLGLVLLCGTEAFAQSPVAGPLVPGQRLRVTAAAPGRFTGMLVGSLVKLGPDSLTLVDPKGGAVTELPVDSITRVEVSHQRRHTKQGLLIGTAVGIFAGALLASGYSEVGCGTYGGAYVTCNSYSDAEKAGIVAVSVVGDGLIGAWLGHRKQSDDWSDAPLERLRVTVRPERGGGRVALTFSF